MLKPKTPGIYVEEVSTLPRSVAEVETDIPAFIGYTEKARKTAVNDLILKPTNISSLKEYETYFGYPEDDIISVTMSDNPAGGFNGILTEPDVNYLMYFSIQMFFANGGGKCYVISVGTYQTPAVINLRGDSSTNPATSYGLQDGLDVLASQHELTLIVIPEAVKLGTQDYSILVQAMLLQCGMLRNRFAILDLHHGGAGLDSVDLKTERAYFGVKYLKYGAVYYPFIRTKMNFFVNRKETNVHVAFGTNPRRTLPVYKKSAASVYQYVKELLKNHFVILPPSAAIAGVYAATDANRGVWKAPANVSLANVVGPMVNLNSPIQADFNVDAETGKSINVIRSFPGKGAVVWGARTLAGNDYEWRYIPVVRFFAMVEKSVKNSTQWVVFEPNENKTWVRVRAMIENYLVQKWREGALAGTTPKEAFFVKCGLGTTMTSLDILGGRLNVEIGMAVVRPAEFIILKFTHQMQA